MVSGSRFACGLEQSRAAQPAGLESQTQTRVASSVAVRRLAPLGSDPRRRGVVLVDAIVAAVLLGVALAVMIGLGGRALSSQSTGEQLQAAAMLIDEQLNLVLARGPDSYASRFQTQGQCDPPFQNYSYHLEFSEGQGGDAYRVTATVSWLWGGTTRSESVETLIAPRLGDEPDPARKPDEVVNRWY